MQRLLSSPEPARALENRYDHAHVWPRCPGILPPDSKIYMIDDVCVSEMLGLMFKECTDAHRSEQRNVACVLMCACLGLAGRCLHDLPAKTAGADVQAS